MVEEILAKTEEHTSLRYVRQQTFIREIFHISSIPCSSALAAFLFLSKA